MDWKWFTHSTDQDISWRTYCSSLLLIYFWPSLPVCFGSLSCISTNSWPIRCIPDGNTWCCSMQWKVLWFNLSFTWCKSLTLQLAKALHTITEPPPPRGCSFFINSSPQIEPPIWPQNFELWFISPKDFIPLLYCSVFVCLIPLEPFDIDLVSWQQFYPIGQLQRFFSSHWMLTHFFVHNIDSVVRWCLEQSAFCQTSRWLMCSN